MGNKPSSPFCGRLSKWCFGHDGLQSNSANGLSTDDDLLEPEFLQERKDGSCRTEPDKEPQPPTQKDKRQDAEDVTDSCPGSGGERRQVSCDQVFIQHKAQGQLEAGDFKVYHRHAAHKLPLLNCQRSLAQLHESQGRTVDANFCSSGGKLSDLPLNVECDEVQTPEAFPHTRILQYHISEKEPNNEYLHAVESKPAYLHQEKVFLQEKQNTTRHTIFTSDDDDRNEASKMRRPSSCSIHSTLGCSDDESSSDEDSRPDINQAKEGGTSFETTDPASSLFCPKWEVSGVFGSEGGVLQKLDSDIQLLIPPGAIKSGFEVTVRAAVKADLEHLYDKLEGKLKKEEVIVSPAAEFWVGKDWKFEKPVTIILPHILPSDYTADDVHVYHITRDAKGGATLSAIPNRDSPRPKGANSRVSTSSFRVNGDFVTVQTDHFSAVLCTHCSKKSKVKRHPELFIRGCGTFTNCGSCQAINLSVLIWDKRLHIKDFMMQEHGIKIAEYQEPVFIRTSSKLKDSLGLRVVRSKHHPELRHCQDAEGKAISPEEMTFEIKNKFGCQKCIKKGKYSLIQHQWCMELPPNSPEIDGIRIHVLVSMEPIESAEDHTPVSFVLKKTLSAGNMAAIQAEKIPPSDEKTTYKYVKRNLILAVANALGRDGSKTFFLNLGLSDNQFEDITVKNMPLCDKNFELLKKWCQSKQARNEGALYLLKESLQKYDRKDLAEIVEQFENSK